MRTFSFLQIRKVFATFSFFIGKGEERKIIIRNEQWKSSSFTILISRSNFFCSCQLPRGCDLRNVGTFHLIRWGKLQFPTFNVTFPAIHYSAREFVKWKFQSWKLRSCSFPHNTQQQNTHIHTELLQLFLPLLSFSHPAVSLFPDIIFFGFN